MNPATELVAGFVVGHFGGIMSLRFTAGAAQGIGNDPLQLAVHAAELAGGPLFQGLHRSRVHSQQKAF